MQDTQIMKRLILKSVSFFLVQYFMYVGTYGKYFKLVLFLRRNLRELQHLIKMHNILIIKEC